MPQKCPFLKLKILPILSPKNGSFVDLIWRLLNPGRRQLWRRVLPMPFVERRRGRSRRPRKRKSCCVGSVKFRFQVVNRILSPAVAAVETSAQSFKSFVRNDVVVVVVVCRRRPKTQELLELLYLFLFILFLLSLLLFCCLNCCSYLIFFALILFVAVVNTMQPTFLPLNIQSQTKGVLGRGTVLMFFFYDLSCI